MDSYFFGWYLGRPASPPLPDEYSGGYLPQMPAYSDTSPSGRSSGVPQPIDFGGSVTGYCSDASQSRDTSVPPIEYGSASQSGGATGSSASQRTSTRRGGRYSDEEKSKAISAWRASGLSQSEFCQISGIAQTTFNKWVPLKSRTHYTAEKKSAALSAWRARRETETQLDIATRLGIPLSTFNEWIRIERGFSRDAC